MSNKGRLSGIRVIAAINSLELFGHERGNIEVFKALIEMGAEVRVGVNAREDGGEVAKELASLDIPTFPIAFGLQWSSRWLMNDGHRYVIPQFRQLFAASAGFYREVQKFQPTHIHIGASLVYSFISIALLRCKHPLIWRMGDCPPTDSRFNMPIWRAGMRRTTRVVANSDFVRMSAEIEGIPLGRITKIYNLAPSSSGSDLLPPPLSDGEKALIYVGAISEHKGLIPLIEAYAKVRNYHSNLKLWILGGSRWDQDFRSVLDRLLAEHEITEDVLFAGHIKDPSPWYTAAAIHLAPSVWDEPGANVVMEAKRTGTPSIVFPSGGLPEMIRQKTDGFICDEKTSESLAEAIHWMLEDRDRLATMGRSAFEDSQCRFGKDRFLHEWAQVYLDTLR
jgi:glycosyltransferase involved in cell wall biosynthesis